MGSALAYWAYHRRLSLDAQRIRNPDLQVTDLTNSGGRPRIGSMRTESESSTTPARDERRVSMEPDDSDDDEQDHERSQDKAKAQETVAGGKRPRRFSMDFLFGKKSNKQEKQEKAKKKRSQSISVQSETDAEIESRVREFRYPGIHNSDFAALYFF